MQKTYRTILTALLLIIVTSCSQKPKVKLVLQITVDQLRGDVIDRYKKNFTDGGFNYLLNNGKVFTDAHFIHAITKTAPGHSTLSTGATPALHGVINNDWFDKEKHREVYSCEDHDSHILGDSNDTRGRSPKNLLAPTLGDNLIASNSKSKVFGISVKDRGAILMAGHSGKAFWFSNKKGGFATSKYYYDDYPEWLKNWNGSKLLDEYYKNGWNLIYTKDKYEFGDKDETSYERTLPELGKTFPHGFQNISKEKFYSILPFSPWGDRFTYEFAKELIANEQLGADDDVDYLSISFSCTDYIGHLFGPNTLEYEDQIFNLDKTLSDLFAYIDENIGLDNVLIVLSADHGVCDTPEFLIEQGQKSGILSTKEIVIKLNSYTREKYDISFDAVLSAIPPDIYLDEEKLKENNIDICSLEKELSEVGGQIDGVYKIYTDCGIVNKAYSDDELFPMIENSYFKGRSGNLYIVNDKNWYLAWDTNTRRNAATHGSPWEYDTYVPLIFCGSGIQPQMLDTQAGPHDIAPTIADYIGIPAPAKSVGKSLLK